MFQEQVDWKGIVKVSGDGEYKIEGVKVSEKVYKHVYSFFERLGEEPYVVQNVASVVSNSIRTLAHGVDEFIEYGDFKLLKALAEQLREDFKVSVFETRPYIVVLYGPPGTGKTTWIREIARRILFTNGVMDGLYLELTAGSLASMWAGIPIKTLRAVLDLAASREFITILLIDEADSIFVRPQNITGGVTLEQIRMVSELKSRLGELVHQPYPMFIGLTTNFKDLFETDPALADRITAWIHVPPPPLRVKEKIAVSALKKKLTPLSWYSTYIGLLLRLFGEHAHYPFFETDEKGYGYEWYLPVLPYDGDYLVGLLMAFGWNPLEFDLALTHEDAVKWSDRLVRIYARVLITLTEMARIEGRGSGSSKKSFLRTFNVLKRGIEDTAKFHIFVYVYGFGIAGGKHGSKNSTPNASSKIRNMYTKALITSLGYHPYNPTVLLFSVAKYAGSSSFIRILNNVVALASPTVHGIRMMLAPLVMLPPDTSTTPSEFAETFKARIDKYNMLVARELREGRLLEHLRILLTEKDTEKAVEKALEVVSRLPIELEIPARLSMLAATILHPVIHAEDEEKKAEMLYRLVSDEKRLEEAVEDASEKLGVGDALALIKEDDGVAPKKDGSVLRPFWILSSNMLTYNYVFERAQPHPHSPTKFISEDMESVIGRISFARKRIIAEYGRRLGVVI